MRAHTQVHLLEQLCACMHVCTHSCLCEIGLYWFEFIRGFNDSSCIEFSFLSLQREEEGTRWQAEDSESLSLVSEPFHPHLPEHNYHTPCWSVNDVQYGALIQHSFPLLVFSAIREICGLVGRSMSAGSARGGLTAGTLVVLLCVNSPLLLVYLFCLSFALDIHSFHPSSPRQ